MEGGGGIGIPVGRSGETTIIIDGIAYSPEAYWRRQMLERQDQQIALLKTLIDLTEHRMDQHQAVVWQALIDRLEPENIRMREAIRQARELVQKIDDDELRISIMKALDW